MISNILRSGHVQLRVLDVEESTHFYSNVMGLVETGRDDVGRVYLKGWDERDHSSVILREASSPGLDTVAFKVRSPADLARIEGILLAAGASLRRAPAGDTMETGETLGLALPSGHTVEFYAHKAEFGNGLPLQDPPAWHAAAEHGMGVQRFDHCVLYGPALDEVIKLFVSHLGFYVAEQALTADGKQLFGAWLSTSHRPGDIVFIRHALPGKLHRIAFRVESAEQVLKAADCFSMNRIQIDTGPFRDPVGRRVAVQAFDPSGNRVEVFWSAQESQPDSTPVTWSWKKAGADIALRDQRTRDRLFCDVT